jgi:hypothetical protein
MRDVMHLTMPQIIILSHAAYINSKRMDERLGRNSNAPQYDYSYNDNTPQMISDDAKKRPYDASVSAAHDSSKIVGFDPQVSPTKTLSAVASDFDVLARYLSDWSV